MKKTVLVVLGICCLSANIFAKFVISPTIGISNFHSTELLYDDGEKNTVSWTSMNFGVSLGTVNESGFTFLFSTDFFAVGTMEVAKEFSSSDKQTGTVDFKGGPFINVTPLLGYTYHGIKNLYLTFATGLNLGYGTLKVTKFTFSGVTSPALDLQLNLANIGIPFYIGAQYYFTEKIGINLGIQDAVGIGWVWYNTNGLGSLPYFGTGDIDVPAFTNVFSLKIGPVFRL
ncbi:DUF2715 domain-containing protein [Treponema sp. Marseille-Q4523]|uniref:DUF2715 domain-containing protein n=1 Tax=Treponema sp. Marseille-Q4523 TaxID=2810610 RepID=UPI0019603963|nr:DUF2715 domain-containing protein [Treponema sp. Marseille-Q4523]MBM7021814.1 DUF2715 domain-containing protein [Treponema sp. Marseille-Q4523]